MRGVRPVIFLQAAGFLCAFFLTATGPIRAETETVLRAGITREITDFDSGESSTVIRGGASFSIDDVYRFSFTSMKNRDTGNLTGTWFIEASPEDTGFSFVLGNYSLHFGSGILMGKKEFIRPDPFSRKLSFTRDTVFSGSQSGNPAYSFSGIAASAGTYGDILNIRIVPFCSLQRRFISAQQAYDGAVSSSLMAVNTRTVKEGLYDSPADIMNSGIIADADFMELFHVQVYGFTTTLQSACGGSILWDRTSSSPGTGRSSAYGLFAEYRDSSISIFAEPAGSTRSGPGWSIHGECIALGFSLRNEIFNTALNGKFSDSSFRSLYASGDSGPENILDFSVSAAACEHFRTGAAFYSEKDLTVNPGSDERKCFIREEALASITGFRMFGADFRFSRKVPLHGDSSGRSRQYSGQLNFTPSKNFYLHARHTGQCCEAGISRLWGIESKAMFLSYFSLSAGYTWVKASPDNILYAVITPASENNMDIGRFTSGGEGWSVKIKYSSEKDSFFFRWCRINDGENIKHNAESAMVLVF